MICICYYLNQFKQATKILNKIYKTLIHDDLLYFSNVTVYNIYSTFSKLCFKYTLIISLNLHILISELMEHVDNITQLTKPLLLPKN